MLIRCIYHSPFREKNRLLNMQHSPDRERACRFEGAQIERSETEWFWARPEVTGVAKLATTGYS